MKKIHIIGWALVHALATSLYVYGVVGLMNFVGNSNVENEVSLLAPFGFLLLFVISVAITASLVFGRPLLWYLNKRPNEAIALAAYTIAWLAVIAIFVFSLVLINLPA